MLAPKKLKFRKMQKGRLRGVAQKGNTVAFGEFGLQALETGFLTSRQIEAARIAMTRYIKRGGKLWIRVFPHRPVTKKPAETRMGGGKGMPEYYAARIKRGTVLYEMEGVTKEIAQEALRLAAYKLPMTTRFVTREELA